MSLYSPRLETRISSHRVGRTVRFLIVIAIFGGPTTVNSARPPVSLGLSSVFKIQSNALRPGEWVILAGKNLPREHIALCSTAMDVPRRICIRSLGPRRRRTGCRRLRTTVPMNHKLVLRLRKRHFLRKTALVKEPRNTAGSPLAVSKSKNQLSLTEDFRRSPGFSFPPPATTNPARRTKQIHQSHLDGPS